VPLEVRISINDRPITMFRIGSEKGGTNPRDINTYRVWEGFDIPTNAQWMESPQVKHRYGDGAEVLVAKALAAVVDPSEEY